MKLALQIILGGIAGLLMDRYYFSYQTSPLIFTLQLIPLCVLIAIAIHLLMDDTQKS
jgi:hypothetical protein